MTALQLRRHRQRQQAVLRRQRSERRGSTLLIVLVLMAMLASLGVIFYVFAAQERASANFYSEAAKVKQFDISADTLFDFGVRQLIEGPEIGKFRNSALSGRRHALLPNMLGLAPDGKKLDFAPFNGNPLDSTSVANWSINDSASALGGTERQPNVLANRDPDYTYPDNNNVFLSYDGYDPIQGRRIIIPSFHRPQSERIKQVAGWYSAANTVDHVLRPHENHIFVPSAGRRPPSPAVPRYLTATDLTTLGGTWPSWGVFPTTPRDWDGDGNRGEQGVWSLNTSIAPGAALPANANNIEYDVDNDGDGLPEGVWLDLDFPVLEDASGMEYVPFFSFTVKEMDALLNLNVHGNMASVWNGDVSLTTPFRNPATPSVFNQFVSKSNQGQLPSEVNPLWALNRRPQNANPTSHDGAYASDPLFGANPLNWMEAANREWQYLLMGRYSTTPSDLVPGRWGEEHLLYRAIVNSSTLNPLYFSTSAGSVLPNPWPGPGQTQMDDDSNLRSVGGGGYGNTFAPFGHPMDYTGLGRYWNTNAPKQLVDGGVGVPAWPQYTYYSRGTTLPASWPTVQNSFGDEALFNQADETVTDGDSLKDEDGVFGADEMRALHLDRFTDFVAATGGQTRLTQLAPFNFDPTAITTWNGGRLKSDLMSKFTTRSWDRKQFSLGYNPNVTTRAWEFSPHQLNSTPPIQNRRANNAQGNSLYFPPQIGSSIPYSQLSAIGPVDPFRPLLRKLIEVQSNNVDQPNYQLRLNLNQLLVGPNGTPDPQFLHPGTGVNAGTGANGQLPPNLQLNTRPLTPHPDQSTLSADSIETQLTNAGLSTAPPYPANGNFTSPIVQEYWARRDRQLMARDIFMLMYTLTWPESVMAATNNPAHTNFASDTENQPAIRQLAQYAINVVDSLDRDNISSRFEFDMNPTNGWDLDDNPYTYSETDRYEVYGVERLDLTLSEALAVRAEATTSNLGYNNWDDTENRYFMYVELRNPGPYDADYSNHQWRIDVGPDDTDQVNVTGPERTNVHRLILLQGAPVLAGELFTIASADAAAQGTHPSVMKVAPDAMMLDDANPAHWIAPAQIAPNLDLRSPTASTQCELRDALNNNLGLSGTGVGLYNEAMYTKVTAGGGTNPLYVRLYRRASPQRTIPTIGNAAQEEDNPFILVDEIALNNLATNTDSGSQGGVVRLTSTEDSTSLQSKLGGLRSRRHREPFSTASSTGNSYTQAATVYANTLGNDNATAGFRNWQKVFDRDFASVAELMQLTLGGFSDTERLRTQNLPTANILGRMALPGVVTRLNVDNTQTNSWIAQTETTAAAVTTIDASAEALFRPLPQGAAAIDPPRWHRLLEFVEVPTRMHANIPGFPNPLDYPRVPGKINANMLRHPEVLAALLDDPGLMSLFVDEDLDFDGAFNVGAEDINGNGTQDVLTPALLRRTDQNQPAGVVTARTDYTTRTIVGTDIKSWWEGLVASRDGSLSGGTRSYLSTATSYDITGLFLPGLPGSRPFRSFGAALQAGAPILTMEDTLLRSWPGDDVNRDNNGTSNPRGLFELGTADEHWGTDQANNAVQQLDPYVRQRLLSKVLNNLTTRSNVFVVFASVKYFRAHTTANGEVRIGGPLKDPAATDRWLPEHRRMYVIDRSQIEKAYDPQSGTFNFRALIEFQQDLVGFP